MAKAKTPPPAPTAIQVTAYDGRRQPFTKPFNLRLKDGAQNQLLQQQFKTASAVISVPFANNFKDKYTVLVDAPGCRDAGFTPVKVVENTTVGVDLMLLPREINYNFHDAAPEVLNSARPEIWRLLDGTPYHDLPEEEGGSEKLACLLNLLTAMRDVHLRVGSVLDYLQQITFDETLAQDRFFGWADPQMLPLVQEAQTAGVFAPEAGSGIFHPGATKSYKQTQFGEANVQITFHENDKPPKSAAGLLKVEIDMDYFQNLLSHALLEVIPNTVSKKLGMTGLTDPATIYVLRWIAGRRAGVPEFNPPYWIEAA